MSSNSVGDSVVKWALHETSISALVQIGSRTRQTADPGAADLYSDWDFQIVTSQPELFQNRALTEQMGLGAPLAYVQRGGRLGSAVKVTTVVASGELDLVIVPLDLVRKLEVEVKAGRQAANPLLMRAVLEQSLVLRGGYRILKGDVEISDLLSWIATEIRSPRLSDNDIHAFAEGFVCDYVSIAKKLERGERIAAQRWLHHTLAETNFQLLHELRQRINAASFPDARRVESLVGEPWSGAVAIDAALETGSLKNALEKSAETCRQVVRALIGDRWHWPDLSSRLRRE